MDLSTKLSIIAKEEDAKSERLVYLRNRMYELLGDSSYEEIENMVNSLSEGLEKVSLTKVKEELDNIFNEIAINYYNNLIEILKELPYAKEKRLPRLYQFLPVSNIDKVKTLTLSQFKLQLKSSLDDIQVGDWIKVGTYPFYVYEDNNELNVISFDYDTSSNIFSLPNKALPVINYWGANCSSRISALYEGITRFNS